MRNIYLVAYDVANDKRLRRMHGAMLGFGDPLQYSVFYCELSAEERQSLKDAVWEILEFGEDRVLLADLGPVDGRGDDALEFWGNPRCGPPKRSATII